MGNLAAETLLHGIIAAVVILVFLHLCPVHAARIRLHFWLLALLYPVFLTPLFSALAPFRRGEFFRDERALFSGSHFVLLQWHGARLGTALAVMLALAGTVLFLRDLIPFAWEVVRRRAQPNQVAVPPQVLTIALRRAADSLGVPAPRLLVQATTRPLLICRGLRRPTIVASMGLVEALAPDELEAALVHEMFHVAWRDPAFGWGLMLARGLFFFNPAIQLVARATVQEIEQRADAAAAHLLGKAEPLVHGLRKLAGVRNTDPERPGPSRWQGLRLHAIERRCRVLLAEHGTPAETTSGWRWVAMGVGLGVILFFTVA